MPTGGGKSLCYQLPALAAGKTAIVVSPLIALMQDQVAQLAEMGIPAAMLNSSLPPNEQRRHAPRPRRAHIRLLYLSPERLARPTHPTGCNGAAGVLRHRRGALHFRMGPRVPPGIPPAQPMREHFPDKPIAAFTASATRRVRHDILSSSSCGTRRSTSPASIARTCAMSSNNATLTRRHSFWCALSRTPPRVT